MNVRIGFFFASVGALILFVFAASYMIEEPHYYSCLGGMVCLVLGIVMIIRNRKPSEKAERFRYVRKMRNRKKKD
jgi:hypothetical protein